MDYFYNNKLLSNKQFGFIKGRSTVTQLLIVLDKWDRIFGNGRDRLMSYIQTSKKAL
jgi:hypothetical protein